MKTKILVPIDFTDIAEAGIATAVNIAKQYDAKVFMLHIIDENAPKGFREDADLIAKAQKEMKFELYITEMVKEKKRELGALVGRFGRNDVEIEPIIAVGDFQKKVNECIEKNSIDLVIMGTSGETSLSEFFSGNHAAQTIRSTGLPVLAVKEQVPVTRLDTILILVDLKDYKKETVKTIKRFAEMFDMRVSFAHVKQNKDLIEENIHDRLDQFAKENDFKGYKIYVIGKGKKTEKVEELTGKKNITVVAAISEVSSGVSRFFFGSDTEKFLNKMEKPLLAISE